MLLLLLSLTLAGCWNRREISDIKINTALGIDRITVEGKPRYLFSALSLRLTETGGAAAGGTSAVRPGGQGIVISAEGDTIYEALRNCSLRSSRQLFMSHTLVLVIGEETVAGGISEIIDFAARHKDLRKRTWVVVCEGLARDVLQAPSEIERLNAIEISKIEENNRPRIGRTVAADLFQVMYALIIPGREAAVANLKLFVPPETSSPIRQGEKNASAGGSTGASAGSGGSEPAPPAQNKTFVLSGAAVFRGDRLAGRMNEEETQGMNFITGQVEGGIIPVAFGGEQKNCSFLFRGLKSDLRPVFAADGSIGFEVRLRARGELLEQNNAAVDISKEELKKLEELINREVERRCLLGVRRAQELNSDVLGFGDKVYRKNPKAWRELKDRWGEIFPTVQVTVKADFRVEHIGLLGKPIVIE